MGNWLIDLKGKRPVRIDVSQFHEAGDGTQIESFRKLFASVMRSKKSPQDIAIITEHFTSVFDFAGSEPELEKAIHAAVQSNRFKNASLGIQQRFALRTEVASYFSTKGLAASVKLNTTSRNILSSLGRLQSYQEHAGKKELRKLKADDVAASVIREHVKEKFNKISAVTRIPFNRLEPKLNTESICDFLDTVSKMFPH